MLSFGIELSRAFWIAVASVAFASGSGPPSRAATMIARDSLEKSFPRFASAAPFLCLMLDHLLCPDIDLLSDHFQETLVDAGVLGQLGVERRGENTAFADEDRLPAQASEHLHVRARLCQPGRPDEDAAEGLFVPVELDVVLEARDLAAVGVALDLDVHEVEMPAVEENHPRAGAEERAGEGRERLLEAVDPHETAHRGRLAAGNDEAVEPVELLRLADLDDVGAEPAEHGGVLAEVALDCQDADADPFAHPARNSSARLRTRFRMKTWPPAAS